MISPWGVEHSVAKGLPSALKKPGALHAMQTRMAQSPHTRKQFDYLTIKRTGQLGHKNRDTEVGRLMRRKTKERKAEFNKVYAEEAKATPAEIKAARPGKLHLIARHNYKKAKSFTTYKDDEGTTYTGPKSLGLPAKRVQRGKGQLL